MPILQLENVDLRRDAAAGSYLKREVVDVEFARCAGELQSPEGINRFQKSDALVTGSTGNRWCVSRERFDAKYEPLPPLASGEDGPYRCRPLPVLARQMNQPFCIDRSEGGDRLRGQAGDWLLQYAPGDYGIVQDARFRAVYSPSAASGPGHGLNPE